MANSRQNETPRHGQEGYYPPIVGFAPRAAMPQRQAWENTTPQGYRRNATTPPFYSRQEIPAHVPAAGPVNLTAPRNHRQFGYGDDISQAGGRSARTPTPSAAAAGRFPKAEGGTAPASPAAGPPPPPANQNNERRVSTQNIRTPAGTDRGDGIPQYPRAPFRPSYMANPHSRARRENPSPEVIASRVAAGVSANYRGNYRLARNRPADIPQEENCSVYITGLSPNVTTHQLLAAIHNTGRVWANVISPPTRQHGMAAAKVTFFKAVAAQIFLARANGPGQPGFFVDGVRATVRPDRNRVAEAPEPDDHTRCISIAGPVDIVTVPYLMAHFSRDFVFEVDEIIPLVMGQSINILEWRFGSYRCQAQWGWRNLREDPFFQSRGVRVRFENDPCDL
ncbi:hypothetical protein B0I37DRAFT_411353 [Chaetomium sp. MPI-CAGE-AT-0009]|nr:hypothetical protein B0I37DRAFT_411353 [Chaetomium sp. MPI-CAGE-AT-0009]